MIFTGYGFGRDQEDAMRDFISSLKNRLFDKEELYYLKCVKRGVKEIKVAI